MYKVDQIQDSSLQCALFRDYSALASAFLLEHCHDSYMKTSEYGLGRDYLPEVIAVPLTQLAEKLSLNPFLEYNTLTGFNYRRVNQNQPYFNAEDIELIRHLQGGIDEKGFLCVHIAMVQHTGDLVKSTMGTLQSVEDRDRKSVNENLEALRDTLKLINGQMKTMWKYSKPEKFHDFRTYIMGIQGNSMFPNGVIYRGVDSNPRFYRGASGANDCIMPTVDHLLEITKFFPENPNSKMMEDFNKYRFR